MAEPRPLNAGDSDSQKKRGSSGSSGEKESKTKQKYSVAPKTKTGLAFTPEPDGAPAKTTPKKGPSSPSQVLRTASTKRPGILRDSSSDSGPQPTRSTIDKRFADSYSQQASIQPSVGGVSRTSNVKVDLKNPHQRRDARGRVVDGKRRMTDSSNQVVVVESKKNKKQKVADSKERQAQMAANAAVVTGNRAYREPAERVPRNFVGRQYTKAKIRAKKKPAKKTSLKSRAKATAVNTSMMSWLVPSYFFIQLPFAILNLIFLGMTYVILSLTKEDEDTIDEETGVLGTLTNFFWDGVKLTVNAFNEAVEFLTGFDFLEFVGAIPQMGYMLTVAVLMGYAMFTLLTMGLMYMFAGLKPLSGKGKTAKIVTFMMCFVGYFAPFFNLFPWAVVWAAAVWKNPK